MATELTQKDIELMKQELDYRRTVLTPQLTDAVKVARGFGDLSENFEYKAAKQEKNKNESRMRYLENTIKNAVIIKEKPVSKDTVSLYDKVTLWMEDDDEETEIRIVTTVRQNALQGLISKESPVGRAVLGKKVGDRVTIVVSPTYSYEAVIKAVEPGEDTGEAPLRSY